MTPSIENKNDLNNYTDNGHGIMAYLDDRAVAQKILPGLVTWRSRKHKPRRSGAVRGHR